MSSLTSKTAFGFEIQGRFSHRGDMASRSAAGQGRRGWDPAISGPEISNPKAFFEVSGTKKYSLPHSRN